MDHPPLESTAPSDWRYTAEGGANLVLSFVGQPGPFTGKLLRLRKKKLSHATGAIPEEVDVEFGRQIIQPLLGAQQVVAMERLAVTRDWLSTLKEALASSGNRPAHREEEDEVDEQTGVVVLAEDLVRGDGVLAIEIKPKWGFLPSPTHLSPSSRDIKTHYCRFCMHSYMKKLHTYPATALDEHRHAYCPLDLYSGDEARVARAIEGLWNAWKRTDGSANNLRFFYEGVRVEPSDTSFLDSFLATTVPSTLYPTTSDLTSASSVTLSRLIAVLVPTLLASPLLSTLATLQASLDPLDIEGISSELGLNLGNASAPPSPLLSPQPMPDEWVDWLTARADEPRLLSSRHTLLSYLLSATFKDCSIFIRLAPSSTPSGDSPFDVSVKAIDLDPKPLDRLPKYYDLDQRIVKTWREMLEERGADGIRKCVV